MNLETTIQNMYTEINQRETAVQDAKTQLLAAKNALEAAETRYLERSEELTIANTHAAESLDSVLQDASRALAQRQDNPPAFDNEAAAKDKKTIEFYDMAPEHLQVFLKDEYQAASQRHQSRNTPTPALVVVQERINGSTLYVGAHKDQFTGDIHEPFVNHIVSALTQAYDAGHIKSITEDHTTQYLRFQVQGSHEGLSDKLNGNKPMLPAGVVYTVVELLQRAAVDRDPGVNTDQYITRNDLSVLTGREEIDVEEQAPPSPQIVFLEELGLKNQMLTNYTSTVVDARLSGLRACFADDGVQALLASNASSIMEMTPECFNKYFGRVQVLVDRIKNTYGDAIPSEYEMSITPKNFLPGRISATEKSLEHATPTVASATNVLGISAKLYQALEAQGHNPPYTDACIVGAFKLDSNHPYLGGHKMHAATWMTNCNNRLRALGIVPRKKQRVNEKKRLERVGLISYGPSKETMSCDKDWAKKAQGALLEYLSQKIQ